MTTAFGGEELKRGIYHFISVICLFLLILLIEDVWLRKQSFMSSVSVN